MTRQHLSANPKDPSTRSPEKMRSIRVTNRVNRGSRRKTRPRHSISDIFTVVSGIGLLKILRTALPKLDLGPSATGKKQAAPAGIEKTASASSGAKAARVSWIDVLKQLYVGFSKDRVMAVAAGVTFYALLSIFPAIAAFVSLYGLIGDPGKIQGYLDTMKDVLPGGAIEVISDQVKRIASKGGGALGLGLIIGLATALWSANAGVKAMFDALNIVYEAEEKRSFFALNLRSLAFTIGTVAFLLIALTAIIGIPLALSYIGFGPILDWIVWLARWPALLGAVILMLALLYRYGPCRDTGPWRWITPGSAIAAFLWLVASAGFSWYAANFGSYNETYGTLGAAIGLMTWLWISINIVLVGGEINSQLEERVEPEKAKAQP
jgi:membrane protein